MLVIPGAFRPGLGAFFRYLVAAWQQIFPQAGEIALEAGEENPSLRRETRLDLLLNDLTKTLDTPGTGQALLVLDDYHRIEAADIHETILYFVEHLPPRCHLALLTRADPPLPLARWRSRGLLLEARADDLRFTPVEAMEYLNQSLRLGLTESQIAILQERTEGWIAGLQMAALSLQGRKDRGRVAGDDVSADTKDTEAFVHDFDGSNRFVLDYLVEEVVNCQPKEVQQFLRSISILDQFCGPLCDELLGVPTPYSQGMLERLEKINLFLIPLDDRRCWFRYHHLFADLLRLRLQQAHPEQIPALYRRAAEWFAQNGLWQGAIRYGLQTKDLDYSTSLFEHAVVKGGLDFLFSGIRPLIEPFPAAMIESNPFLSLAKAEVILESSQLEGIEPLLRFAEEGIRTSGPFPGQEDVLGWVYLIQMDAATLLGKPDWAIEASQQVPKRIPKDLVTKIEGLVQFGLSAYRDGNLNQAEMYWQECLDLSLANHNTYYIISLLNCMARLTYLKGEFKRSEALFQQAFELLEVHRGKYPIWLGAMLRDYSDLLRDCNRLEEALALITAAIPLLEKYHTVSALGYGLFSWSRILLAFGDFPAAHEVLNKVDNLRRKYNLYPDLETLAMVTRARVYLEEGQTERAWQTLETCLNSAYSQYVFPREWALIVQAKILVRTGRPDEALTLLAGCLEDAKTNGRGRNGLSICLLTALAYDALGDRRMAFQILGEGLVFAKTQHHQRTLIEEGEPMRALLEAFRVQFPQSPFADYLTEILSFFPALSAIEPGTMIDDNSLYEALTPREAEIIRLMCQGLSNQEIARQLVLSVGTVKFHLHNIFGKLGVRDRPQAIVKVAHMIRTDRLPQNWSRK
jgi:LuxR family maltose regulon positive regulatory protein